ncbi:hypothetical protein CcaverHIS002_0405840 [Cutaneotrichosporon cavernicola]|uniref:FCP1 homology domain-containing protein n=1 Tax=Cutaneotrichosporon cavernicola TaxID=279322 RepID=A0AA48L4D9_9TREE|nr:uncharacterized protein CcaverHIS019_0405840 [Cutaneotrichosporon cavernicola]BEI83980.1 hypothetical protein CcaverHIS002_0405840 [Cutaneotrichosporon cavernicola]BEI91764.1 hypothetical protein CcaverHIS019_0405840 [Cutaneotrichosporon cavernicola]BEI99536.1 hypothetical protein CcaverHIS631_0405790 [Cutaneotrichosporon cavernicola]BEJ07313.1 hypothetical protein CcaverHIS641_0405820 [Cutaneotrichosporon cavernicola]
MNSLSRLDTFIARLAGSGLGPKGKLAATPLASSHPSAVSAEPGPSSLASGHHIPFASSGLSSSSVSASPARRARRRRRRVPTGTSIKLPPPTTPLLLRVALALWSILLAFWRSLVGDTRAVRILRHKQRGLRACDSPPPEPVEAPLPSPASSATSDIVLVEATSDEGSASEAEWIDPVTRADSAVGDTRDESAVSETERKDTFNLSLRSGHSKETVLFRGILDTKLEAEANHKVEHEADIGPRRARLLPNPMTTSLLDPSVPAAPQRHASPAIPAPIVVRPPHQTPFHLQKTLILDLDETLIHSTSRPIGSSSSGGGMLGIGSGLFGRRGRREGHTVEVVLNGRSTTYHVYKRPYVDFFLKKVASWYTLVIYTASMPEYADPVIDWLDNGRGLFAKRLYRESCFLQPSGSYIKDLALVDPDLGRVCFMDNSPISYNWNKANALPIEGWTSDPNDEALLQSIPVLDSLRFVTDVRHILGIRGFN